MILEGSDFIFWRVRSSTFSSPHTFCTPPPPISSWPKIQAPQWRHPVEPERKTKGVENSEEGKTNHKTPFPKRLWPPPPMIHFLSGPVLRDTARLSQRYPPIARYGVFGVSTWPIGCDTPSPFSERFPLGEHAKWRCDTPPLKRGISAILARYPMKTRQMGAIPPSAILSRKGIARYGGVSRTGPLNISPTAFAHALSFSIEETGTDQTNPTF